MHLETVFDTDEEASFITRWFLRKRDKVLIDNIVFYLHYHVTTALFLIGCLIVTIGMFLMDPIDCISDKAVDEVIDNYCLYHSTYTVIRNGTFGEPALESHPGVGTTSPGNTKFHKYYLWVSLLLAIQAASFYIPRGIWKAWSGSRVENTIRQKEKAFSDLVTQNNELNTTDNHSEATTNPIEDENSRSLPVRHHHHSSHEKFTLLNNADDVHESDFSEENFHQLLYYIVSSSHASYYWKLLVCEVLNLGNAFLQLLLMSKFAGFSLSLEEHPFWYNKNLLGLFRESRPFDKDTTIAQIFPKVSACTFYSYGPSGNVINHEAICVLPTNAINEKIYATLYVWLVFVISMSILAVVYRLTILIPSVRNTILKLHLREDQLDTLSMRKLRKRLQLGNWQLLLQLAGNSNIDSWELTTIVKQLCRFCSE